MAMISLNSLNQILNKLNFTGLVKSMNECLHENSGGFLIPSSSKLTDVEYARYRHLEVNWSISPVTKDDLPSEFSPQAVKTVDMFRRKTVDLNFECMILFDYISGDIISCNFSKESDNGKVESVVYPKVFKNMSIASVHNHPIKYCSPPSSKNFQMLGLGFEHYELIFAKNELWILESKNIVLDDEEIEEIRKKANDYFDACLDNINQDFEKGYLVSDNLDRCYGDRLLNYINGKFKNIILTRRYLDG